MEVMWGDLVKLLKNEKPSWQKRIGFALDVSKGMATLHSFNIMHHDLKGKNILIDLEKRTAKVGDLGLSKEYRVDPDTMSGMNVGTGGWMAPERLLDKCDVYGMVLHEIAHFGRNPWEGVGMDFMMKVMSKDRPRIDADVEADQKEFVGLLRACWGQNAEKRPDFQTITEELERITKAMTTDPE